MADRLEGFLRGTISGDSATVVVETDSAAQEYLKGLATTSVEAKGDESWTANPHGETQATALGTEWATPIPDGDGETTTWRVGRAAWRFLRKQNYEAD